MKMYDILKWDDESASVNDIVAFKHEAEDFNTHTQLIVHDSQEAVFFKDGKALDIFAAGRHTLSTQNVPMLGKLLKLPTGGETPFHAEVYFVNKVFMQDLKWGTPTPILMEDPEEGVNIHVRSFGLFGAHIEESGRFLRKIVGTRKMYSKTELADFLRAKLIEKITDLLGKTIREQKVGILNISTKFSQLSEAMQEQITPYFAEFGIAIDNFSFNNISALEEDLRAINDAKVAKRKMIMEAEAMKAKREIEGYTYQQERAFDVMGAAASNESTGSGQFMGAGMGIGMGVAMGGVVGQNMGEMANMAFGNNAQQAQQAPQAVCPSCKAPVAQGAKFCNNCGQKLVATCPNCNAEVTPGAKFCNNCGQKLISGCPACGAETAPGAKFCNNCGQKL